MGAMASPTPDRLPRGPIPLAPNARRQEFAAIRARRDGLALELAAARITVLVPGELLAAAHLIRVLATLGVPSRAAAVSHCQGLTSRSCHLGSRSILHT